MLGAASKVHRSFGLLRMTARTYDGNLWDGTPGGAGTWLKGPPLYLPFPDVTSIESRFGGKAVPPLGRVEPGERAASAPLSSTPWGIEGLLSLQVQGRRPEFARGGSRNRRLTLGSHAQVVRPKVFSVVESMSAQRKDRAPAFACGESMGQPPCPVTRWPCCCVELPAVSEYQPVSTAAGRWSESVSQVCR